MAEVYWGMAAVVRKMEILSSAIALECGGVALNRFLEQLQQVSGCHCKQPQ